MSATLANPTIDVRNGVYEWLFVMPQDVNNGPMNRLTCAQSVHGHINHPDHDLTTITYLESGPSGPKD